MPLAALMVVVVAELVVLAPAVVAVVVLVAVAGETDFEPKKELGQAWGTHRSQAAQSSAHSGCFCRRVQLLDHRLFECNMGCWIRFLGCDGGYQCKTEGVRSCVVHCSQLICATRQFSINCHGSGWSAQLMGTSMRREEAWALGSGLGFAAPLDVAASPEASMLCGGVGRFCGAGPQTTSRPRVGWWSGWGRQCVGARASGTGVRVFGANGSCGSGSCGSTGLALKRAGCRNDLASSISGTRGFSWYTSMRSWKPGDAMGPCNIRAHGCSWRLGCCRVKTCSSTGIGSSTWGSVGLPILL